MISQNTGYMTGKLLLAMPNMGDKRFDHAVIYICSHDENGAMGLVVNHVLPGVQFGSLLQELKLADDKVLPSDIIKHPVINGGPVETSRGFLLHSKEFQHNDTIAINNAISLTGTLDALEMVADGKGPQDMVFALGYAGWGAGQLDDELQANAWLVCENDVSELIFKSTPEDMWSKAIATLGFDPAQLSGVSGHA